MNEQERMAFFFEIFDASLPRLGPGDDASTQKAIRLMLSAMPKGSTPAKILDLGCGNGAQTVQLAKHAPGAILAVDMHPPFLDELQLRAAAEGVGEKIQVQCGDMSDLKLQDASFDWIWSEGALYSMGFQNGLKAYHSRLVSQGLFAVSELCWFKPDPPEECWKFFETEYPPMTDVASHLANIKDCHYEVLEHFTLPEKAWLDCYYLPLEKRLDSIQEKVAKDPERLGMVESFRVEIDMYRKHSAYYGYEFFILRKS